MILGHWLPDLMRKLFVHEVFIILHYFLFHLINTGHCYLSDMAVSLLYFTDSQNFLYTLGIDINKNTRLTLYTCLLWSGISSHCIIMVQEDVSLCIQRRNQRGEPVFYVYYIFSNKISLFFLNSWLPINHRFTQSVYSLSGNIMNSELIGSTIKLWVLCTFSPSLWWSVKSVLL